MSVYNDRTKSPIKANSRYSERAKSPKNNLSRTLNSRTTFSVKAPKISNPKNSTSKQTANPMRDSNNSIKNPIRDSNSISIKNPMRNSNNSISKANPMRNSNNSISKANPMRNSSNSIKKTNPMRNSNNSLSRTSPIRNSRNSNSIKNPNPMRNSNSNSNRNSIYSRNKKYDTRTGSVFKEPDEFNSRKTKLKDDIKFLPTTDFQDDLSRDENGLSTIGFDRNKNYLLNQHHYVVNDEIEILKRKLRDLENKNLILDQRNREFKVLGVFKKDKDYEMKEDHRLLKFNQKHGVVKDNKVLKKRKYYHKKIFCIENKIENKGELNFGNFLKTNYSHTKNIRVNFRDLDEIKKDKEEFLSTL